MAEARSTLGYVSWGAVSLVANLDLAGDPEIVAGNTAYRSDGSLYWRRDDLRDGWNAIGEFDGGGAPEVVLVTGDMPSQVYLLEHDGATRWGPLELPDFGYSYDNGGPPTIADVDGDGQPEIIVAASRELYVIEGDGTVKWASSIQGLHGRHPRPRRPTTSTATARPRSSL